MMLAFDDSEDSEDQKYFDRLKRIGKLLHERLQRELNNENIISMEPLYKNNHLIGIIAMTKSQRYEFVCNPRFIPYLATSSGLYNTKLKKSVDDEFCCTCIIF